jgi:hypothetical protein
MSTLTGPEIISQLREKLQFNIGRHLYGVLGTYAQLEQFEKKDLPQARDHQGRRFPNLLNLNRELLVRIGDEELRQLVKDEARYPQAVRRQLGQKFDQLLAELLTNQASGSPFRLVILKQMELLFTYQLDLSVLRTRATNENHILVLLPGQRRGNQVILFHETEPRFQRPLPGNLIADNHLWEIEG